MDWKRKGILVLVFSLMLLLPAKTPGHAQDIGQISSENLEEVVDLIEDPQKRGDFVKELKGIIRARAAVGKEQAEPPRKGRDVLAIEKLFERFEALSGRLVKSAVSTASLASRLPEGLEQARSFLGDPDNRTRLIKLFINVGAAVALAVILGILFKKTSRRLTNRMTGLPSRMLLGFVRVFLDVSPYAVLLGLLFVLFKFLPSFAIGHSLVLLFFMVLLFYRLAIEALRALLSPDDSTTRILPLADEDAMYLWIWTKRFADYTALYTLIIKSLIVVSVSASALFFFRSVLLLVFPVMLSVLIMQLSREIRVRYLIPGTETAKNRISGMLRFWPPVAVVYAWIAFLFLIARYESGFNYLLEATAGTAVTALILLVSLRLLSTFFNRLFAVSERVRERFPELEPKANQYIRMVRKVFKVVLIILGLGVIAQVWGIPVSAFVASKTGSSILGRVIAIAVTTGVVLLVIEVSRFLSDYLLEEREDEKREISQRTKTLVPMLRAAVKIAAIFIGGVVVLGQLGVDTTPVLAGAGIVGLAIGFGSQTLVKDLINGLFILFEESARVGDWAEAGNKSGLVEGIGLRTVKLRDLEGDVHVIPNSSIDTVTNRTKEFSRYLLDVGVAYREDVDEVIDILKEIGEELQRDPEFGKDMIEPLEIFGLDRFEDSAIIIRARLITRPFRQWTLGREFNRRMKRVFDERGIEIPFPHQTVYMGEPKKGTAPPLYVQLSETAPAKEGSVE